MRTDWLTGAEPKAKRPVETIVRLFCLRQKVDWSQQEQASILFFEFVVEILPQRYEPIQVDELNMDMRTSSRVSSIWCESSP